MKILGARVAGIAARIRTGVGMGALGIAALALAACGGGGGSSSGSSGSSPSPTQYTIGGTVTGLTGTGLVLQDNGGSNLGVSQNGSFTFSAMVSSGGAYSVTVMTQPSGQTCTVSGGSGTATANVTSVAVACAATGANVTIGGTVTGLTGTGLVLQDNGGNNLSVASNGAFTFTTALASGTAYAVTVSTQPSSPSQNCTVANGTGTTGSANVTAVAVSCGSSVGKFAYTADYANGLIYAYTINASTGALTQVATYPDGTNPAAVSLAPNGLFAFSASNSGTEVHAFTINQTTGALTEVSGSPYSTGFVVGSAYPDIGVAPNSANLYLASAGDGEMAGFSINQTTGQLTALPGSPYAAGADAGGIPAFSPNGTDVYVVDQNQTAAGGVYGFSIDATTGALTPISGSPFAAGVYPVWISFTPKGNFAYVSNNGGTTSGANTVSAYSVNAATGALTPLATPTYAMNETPQDLTIDSSGTHLYVAMGTGGSVGEVEGFTINSDGSLTAIAGSPWPVGLGPMFVDIDPTGQFAYVSSAQGTGVYGFTIDATTGAFTAMDGGTPFTTGSEPQFITVDASGHFGYTADEASGTITGFAINQTTGVLTAVPGSPYSLPDGKPFFVSISPEAPGIRD